MAAAEPIAIAIITGGRYGSEAKTVAEFKRNIGKHVFVHIDLLNTGLRNPLDDRSVTKSVAELERYLGYSLFHRTSRGAMPTEEGREFIDRAARLLADVFIRS